MCVVLSHIVYVSLLQCSVKRGMLQFIGSQRVRDKLVTEQQYETNPMSFIDFIGVGVEDTYFPQ